MTAYKDELIKAMTFLATDARSRFIGYGVRYGKAAGTLSGVPEAQLVETPVAENLMVGVATGMSLAGLYPLVFLERFDFVLNAADAIVNHLDKIAFISKGEFSPAVILRVVVGNSGKPLYTGCTHTQDLTKAFRHLVDMPVVQLTNPAAISEAYRIARENQQSGQSSLIVEYKDLWT